MKPRRLEQVGYENHDSEDEEERLELEVDLSKATLAPQEMEHQVSAGVGGDDGDSDSDGESDGWEWLDELMELEKAGLGKDAELLLDTDGGTRDATHWNGWGYADTRFEVNGYGVMRLTGTRYDGLFQGGKREFPEFLGWAESTLGLDLDKKGTPVSPPTEDQYNVPVINQAFVESLAEDGEIEVLTDIHTRLNHSHGHTCQEVYALRHLQRVPWELPDLVILVASERAVVKVVEAAKRHDNVVLIPHGGGTNVTQALTCPTSSDGEKRKCIVSLDLRRMNAIQWINRNNMTACIEAGALGKDLEEKLGRFGLTLGHEPDSSEFSSIGGWVATKSSGMKKNIYGNIEDIVLNVRMVTPEMGIMTKSTPMERSSVGPDPVSLSIGSEGTLGIITAVVVRLRLKPLVQRYESYVFATFRHGVAAMREIALQRVAPASVRLMDNTQFKMGQALKPPPPKPGTANRLKHDLVDQAKKFYVMNYHGFDQDKLCGMVLLFEGNDQSQIRIQEAAVGNICKKYGGIRGGPESGLRGYFLTFMIAYLRDFGLDYGFLSESFETSVQWTDVNLTYERVKEAIRRQAAAEGVLAEPLIGGRVTQTYDTCCAMYFYFGIIKDGLVDPVASFSRIEHAARAEILKAGGTLSHHHGIGKLRKHFYDEQVISTNEASFLKTIKKTLDPKNILGACNVGSWSKL